MVDYHIYNDIWVVRSTYVFYKYAVTMHYLPSVFILPYVVVFPCAEFVT